VSRNEQPVVEPGLGETYCPHFDNVEEETLRRLFSKVAAVRSEDRELFDFTHRRIEVLRTAGGNVDDAPEVAEEEVYELFSESRSGNFAVVIEGEVGTGKSELCAYLAHRLEDDSRPILHVDKDDDLMSLLTERIPEFYREHVGEELPGKTEFEQLEHDIENTPNAVASYASSGALLNLSERGFAVDYTTEQQDGIQEHVRKQLKQLVEREEYGTEVKFVSAGDYRQMDCFDVFATGDGADEGDVPSEDEAIEALNAELWREIRDRYGTASLNEVLQTVGAAFEDTRPVIVFEDFAITAMEARQLRNYMERDKVEDNWDFVVAGTRDSTEVLHTRTAEDRFEFFQTNEPDSNSVLFLDEDSAVDFVQPYLGYFKSFDGSVSYERNDDGTVERLNPAPSGSICAQCGLCDESFRDLFPFHGRFLERIYDGLPESRQSPREFVMIVFEVLEQYYKGFVDAPSSAESLKSLKAPLLVADEVENEQPAAAELFRWYGEEEDGWISVDPRFPMAFGLFDVEDPPGPIEGSSEEGSVRVRSSSGSSSGSGGGGISLGGGSSGGSSSGGSSGGSGGGTTPVRDPVQEEIDEHQAYVGAWMESPGEHNQTGVYIRTGLREAIEHLTDGFALYEGTKLTYNVSSQQDPFVFTNTTETVQPFQIEIDPDEFQPSALRRVLAFGVRCDKSGGNPDYHDLFGRLGTQLASYAEDWREKLRQTYLYSDEVLYKRHAGYDFLDFAVATYAAALVFDDPTEPISAERIAERYASREQFEIHESIRGWCRSTLDVDSYDELESVMGNVNELEEILGELLGVGGSELDLPRLRSRLSSNPPYRVLKFLGRGYIQNIDTRVKLAGKKLRSVADGAYDLRQVIDNLVGTDGPQQAVETVLSDLDGLDLDEVERIYDQLKTYDGVSPQVRESLGQFVAVDREEFEEVTEVAELAAGLDLNESALNELQSQLIEVYTEQSDPYRLFESVVLEPGGGSGDQGERFLEVSEHYVD
jgi:uncharacterized membrane protein YgcG